MKLSIYYGKKVKSTAGKTGYVISVNVNGGDVVALRCADENEREFAVDMRDVISVKDIIVFNDRESLLKESEPVRLGKPVFDGEGKYLGVLTDLTEEKGKLKYAHIGKNKIAAEDVNFGDAVIIKNNARVLKSDVKKNGKILLKRGTPLNAEVMEKAQKNGEYIQTALKGI